MDFKNLCINLILISTLFSCAAKKETTDKSLPESPDILFIAIDDLRPELGCYGNDYIKSPNNDQLAETGVVFTNHFVQVPTCGTS